MRRVARALCATRASRRSWSACCTPTSIPRTSARVGAILARSCPGVLVSLSSEVAPSSASTCAPARPSINAGDPADRRALPGRARGSASRDAGVDARAARDAVATAASMTLAARPRARRCSWSSPGPPAGVIAADAHRRPARLRERHLVRHGRHDGEGRPDPGRRRRASRRSTRSAPGRAPARRAAAAAATRSGRP